MAKKKKKVVETTKQVIHHHNIEKPKKKVVHKDHPLAKHKKKKHPLAEHVEVLDEDFADPIDSVDDDELDMEDIADPLIQPSESEEDIVTLPENSLNIPKTLAMPALVSIDTSKATFYETNDGSQRATLNVSFEEVFRADDYEVRMSAV
jgi:hypothetical protein